MKKFAISLIALAAISTASFASGNRNNDRSDSDTYFGKYATQLKDKATNVNAIAVVKKANIVTSYDRLKWISEENDHGRH